jgi:hypothetical protein
MASSCKASRIALRVMTFDRVEIIVKAKLLSVKLGRGPLISRNKNIALRFPFRLVQGG